MWPRDLIRLPILLTEIASLLREQNSLLRELIQFHTRRPAQTPPLANTAAQLRPPPPIRPRTEKDVFVVTPERRAELDLARQTAQTIPWRTPMETLEAMHQTPEPQIDQPVPTEDLPHK